jgi:hypothetical protein
MTFSLFALSADPANRITRIPLDAQVQTEVNNVFIAQEFEFNARAQQDIVFDGKYTPDLNQCLYIDKYDDIDGLATAITNATSVPALKTSVDSLQSIKALFTGRVDSVGKVIVFVQLFEKRRIISTGGLLTLVLNSQHYTKFHTIGMTIDEKISAILYDKKLRFFSFFVARQIFDLSDHYIVATDKDLNDFASLPIVEVHDNKKFFENADTWVRRKIALIKQNGVLDEVPIADIKKVATQFGVNVFTKKNSEIEMIVMPEDKAELKKLLRFLDEDYYNSSLRSLPHLTNSKIKL